MSEYFIQHSTITDIAEAIRNKTGKTDLLSTDEIIAEIANIETGVDTSDATAVAGDVLSGKTAYVDGEKITGTIPTKTSSDLAASGATVTVPAGYYASDATKSVATTTRANTTISTTADDTNDKLTITASNNQDTGYVTGANKTATTTITLTASGATVTASDGTNKVSKSVATATQATPSVSVNSSGLITASATQTAGYVAAGTKSGTKQLTVQAAKTVTPSTSAQTAVASGRYTTGAVTVAAIPSSYVQLNFNVVGGTSKPSNPIENTIWVNTSTSITSSSIIYENIPTWTSTNGTVMILSKTAVSTSGIDFNAVKTGNKNIWIEPVAVYQYENSKWVYKTAQIYTGGQWVPFWNGELYYKGTKNAVYTNSLTKTDGISYTEANTSITVGTGAYSIESITINNIDFTRFSKLYLNVISTSFYYANNTANTWADIRIIDSAGNAAVSGDIISNGSGHTGKHTYNVSSLKGKYNIDLRIYTYGAHGCYTNFTFDELYLEV